MKETVIAKATRTFSGEVAGYSKRHRFIIKAQAYQLAGNAKGHFSVTAEVPNLRGTDIECGGCMHREILIAWPDVKPIVDLHLSDDDGVPMHAESNGWYQMAGALGGAGEQYHAGNSEQQMWKPDGSFDGYRKPTADECLTQLAEHLRITMEEAQKLRENLAAQITLAPDRVGYPKQVKCARAMFAGFVSAQIPRWNAEAVAALALIRSLGNGIATERENKAALKRQADLEKAAKSDTLQGVPVPPVGAVFTLSKVEDIIMPHPFVIGSRHMAGSSGVLDPSVAPCAHCGKEHSEHVKQKTLFVVVPQNTDLNAVPGLGEYLSTNKATFEALGIQGFAMPTKAQVS